MKDTYYQSPTSYQQLRAYLQLMRPANIITAWADILAGFAASGAVLVLNSGLLEQSVYDN